MLLKVEEYDRKGLFIKEREVSISQPEYVDGCVDKLLHLAAAYAPLRLEEGYIVASLFAEDGGAANMRKLYTPENLYWAYLCNPRK